jgi:hypothetical protein
MSPKTGAQLNKESFKAECSLHVPCILIFKNFAVFPDLFYAACNSQHEHGAAWVIYFPEEQ